MEPSRNSIHPQVKLQSLLDTNMLDMQKLRTLLDSLKEKYPEAADYFEERQEERIQQEQEIESLAKQITSIKERYLSCQKTIENLKSQLSQFQKSDDQLKQLQIKDHASRLELDKLSSELAEIRTKFVPKERFQYVLNENQDYKNNLADAKIEIDSQEALIAEFKKKLHEAEKLEHQFEEQNYQLRQQIAYLESCKDSALAAQEKYLQYENLLSNNAQEIQNQTSVIENLQIKLKEAEIQAYKLKQLDFDHKNESDALESYKKMVANSEARCMEYQSRLSEMETEQKHIQNQYEIARLLNQNLEKRLSENELKISSLGEKADNQTHQYTQAISSVDTLKSQQKELQKEIQALKSQLLSAHEKNTLLNRYLDEAKGQMGRDKAKVEKLSHLLFEKERCLQELQQLEISLKRSSEIKQDLEKALQIKTQECQRWLADKEQLEADAKDRCLHIEQLERVIHFLRERSQEAVLELNQLRGEYQCAQDNILALQTQLDLRQVEIAEADKVQKHIEEQKQEALTEIAALQAQQEKLISENDKLQSDTQSENAKFEAVKTILEQQVKTNEELELLLAKKNEILANFDKEIGLIKQTLVRAVREAKEIESLYQDTVQEKINALTKIHQHQQQIEKYRENETLYKAELSKYKEQLQKINVAVAQMESSQRDLHLKHQQQSSEHASEIEGYQSLIKNKDKEKDSLTLHCKQAEEEMASLKMTLSQLQHTQQENDMEVRTAQQHLAKKMKEMAILEDKYHQHHNQYEEMQKLRAQDQIKIVELQTALDVQKELQLRQEHQLQDRLQTAERQQSRWEEKCSLLQDKMNELEKIEERYHQLQALMSNFGAIMGNPSNLPKEADAPKEIKEPLPRETPAAIPKIRREENQVMSKPYQNLFDMPKSSGKYKQNLLD